MHVAFRIGETALMLSDCYCSRKTVFQGFALSIAAREEAEARLWCPVIEDDADTSRYICNGLTEVGYNVLAGDNGPDGLYRATNEA